MLKSIAVALAAHLATPSIPTEKAVYAANTPVAAHITPSTRADTEVMLKAALPHPQAIRLPQI